jgi:hypothetical protein
VIKKADLCARPFLFSQQQGSQPVNHPAESQFRPGDHAQPAGWFPAIPNLNEMLIHLNGLRYPWDYLRLLKYSL